MNFLVLQDKLESGKSFTEEIPEGSQERSTGQYESSHGQQVFNLKMMATKRNIKDAVTYIIGYSEVLGQGGAVYNPANENPQGPYRLSRKTPARHPFFSNMFATKILSIQGRGLINRGQGDGLLAGPNGTAGTYKYAFLSVLFEIPRYTILRDDQLGGQPEYRRYTEFFPETNLETLDRPGASWTFATAAARSETPGGTFPGSIFLRQAKGKLKIITYDVHQDYVLLGRLIPRTYDRRTSTVNALAFPQFGYVDQNTGQSVQYPPGTLLLMPTRITPHAQCHPSVFNQALITNFFPRTVDVEFNMVVFDPPTHDPTTVDLSFYGGAAATLVRGHNLVSLPTTIRAAGAQFGDRWVVPVNLPLASFPVGGLKDDYLLYKYSDFEKLWKSVES